MHLFNRDSPPSAMLPPSPPLSNHAARWADLARCSGPARNRCARRPCARSLQGIPLRATSRPPLERLDVIGPTTVPRMTAGHPAGSAGEEHDDSQHAERSEEHTSELQSPMRLSYAV